MTEFSITETNGATVEALPGGTGWRLRVPPTEKKYANAQIDDYQKGARAQFRWWPQTTLALNAFFSGGAGELVGTAGFGFWNAPFGPGTGARLRLPQAAWFFYASSQSNLPLAPGDEAGNGWFTSTIDAASRQALGCAPFALPVLLLNQFASLRRRVWPVVRRRLGITFERIPLSMTQWREYRFLWRDGSTIFMIDGQPVHSAASAPRGPLGFVAWIDNQSMVLTPQGKVRWGVEKVDAPQWLEIRDIRLDRGR